MAKTARKSRRQRRSRHRVRKNKTMKGGMFGAMLAAAAQQAAARGPAAYPQQAPAAAPNQLAFLSQLPRGVISPQAAAAAQAFANQNPQAVANLTNASRNLAPHAANFVQSAAPMFGQLARSTTQFLPPGQRQLANLAIGAGTKLAPHAVNAVMKNPQQAFQLFGKGAAMLGNSSNFKF